MHARMHTCTHPYMHASIHAGTQTHWHTHKRMNFMMFRRSESDNGLQINHCLTDNFKKPHIQGWGGECLEGFPLGRTNIIMCRQSDNGLQYTLCLTDLFVCFVHQVCSCCVLSLDSVCHLQTFPMTICSKVQSSGDCLQMTLKPETVSRLSGKTLVYFIVFQTFGSESRLPDFFLRACCTSGLLMQRPLGQGLPSTNLS